VDFPRHRHPGRAVERDDPVDPRRARRPALRTVTCRTPTSVLLHDRSIIFCRFLTFGQSPSRAAVKILCRSRATFCSWTAQLMTSHSLTPSGPFTVSGIQLALRLG